MLSLTSEYALRAMIYLTRHESDWPIPGRCIAEEARIPPKYLSAVLGNLVRAGVLSASPGKNGGFRMVRPPDRVYLYEVLAPFETVLSQRRPCPFGNEHCSDEDPCAGHHRWKRVREAYARFLSETTVKDISFKERDAGIPQALSEVSASSVRAGRAHGQIEDQ